MSDHDRYRREHMDAPREVKPIPVGPCELAGRLADSLPIDPKADAMMDEILAGIHGKRTAIPIAGINPRQSHAFAVLAHEFAFVASEEPGDTTSSRVAKRILEQKAIAFARAADEAIGKESPE